MSDAPDPTKDPAPGSAPEDTAGADEARRAWWRDERTFVVLLGLIIGFLVVLALAGVFDGDDAEDEAASMTTEMTDPDEPTESVPDTIGSSGQGSIDLDPGSAPTEGTGDQTGDAGEAPSTEDGPVLVDLGPEHEDLVEACSGADYAACNELVDTVDPESLAFELGARCLDVEADQVACDAIQFAVIDPLVLRCVYEDDAAACAELETKFERSAADRYGLGDDLADAPDDAIVRDCVEGEYRLACAEARSRGLDVA